MQLVDWQGEKSMVQMVESDWLMERSKVQMVDSDWLKEGSKVQMVDSDSANRKVKHGNMSIRLQ